MKKVKKILRLYHISEENQNNKVFKPRIPSSALDSGFEDNITKRICFASSISGAYKAIDYGMYNTTYYVHVPINLNSIVRKEKLYKPDEKEVIDCKTTGEYWVLSNVKLKCIGIAKFKYKRNSTSIVIKWIKKFK